MPLVSNENKIVIGVKAILVIILAVIAFLTIPAFANGYPHFGWLCLSVVVFVVTLWMLMSGKRHTALTVLFFLSLVVGIIGYITGVPSEWQRLMTQSGLETPSLLGIVPIFAYQKGVTHIVSSPLQAPQLR
jgi:hypothetical protein